MPACRLGVFVLAAAVLAPVVAGVTRAAQALLDPAAAASKRSPSAHDWRHNASLKATLRSQPATGAFNQSANGSLRSRENPFARNRTKSAFQAKNEATLRKQPDMGAFNQSANRPLLSQENTFARNRTKSAFQAKNETTKDRSSGTDAAVPHAGNGTSIAPVVLSTWAGEALMREVYGSAAFDEMLSNGSLKARRNPSVPNRTQFALNNEKKETMFTELGYQAVARMKNDTLMQEFVVRMLDELNLVVKDNGALNGFIPWYSGTKAVQTFHQLQNEAMTASWVANKNGMVCNWHCYLMRYPDLSRAFGMDTRAASAHFHDVGKAEGRVCTCAPGRSEDPHMEAVILARAKEHEGHGQRCNWLCYLGRYPDLTKSFGKTNIASAAAHYRDYGHAEGRDCTCPPEEVAMCNWQCYLNRYEDVAKAVGLANTLGAATHYSNHGRAEGRDCTCPAEA